MNAWPHCQPAAPPNPAPPPPIALPVSSLPTLVRAQLAQILVDLILNNTRAGVPS